MTDFDVKRIKAMILKSYLKGKLFHNFSNSLKIRYIIHVTNILMRMRLYVVELEERHY